MSGHMADMFTHRVTFFGKGGGRSKKSERFELTPEEIRTKKPGKLFEVSMMCPVTVLVRISVMLCVNGGTWWDSDKIIIVAQHPSVGDGLSIERQVGAGGLCLSLLFGKTRNADNNTCNKCRCHYFRLKFQIVGEGNESYSCPFIVTNGGGSAGCPDGNGMGMGTDRSGDANFNPNTNVVNVNVSNEQENLLFGDEVEDVSYQSEPYSF